MAVYAFKLPWPSRDLSPNTRIFWAKRAKAVKSARKRAFLQLRLAFPLLKVPDGHLVGLEFVFIPPDRRRYDDDGLAARMKAARDGIADYLQVDDHRFRQTHRVSSVPTPNGEVMVKLTILPAPETSIDTEA